MSSIDERFNQPGFQVYANAESLLVKSLKGLDVTTELQKFTSDFNSDVDTFRLSSQLHILKVYLDGSKNECFDEIMMKFLAIEESELKMISEVVKLVKLLLVNPATSASGERSFSAARRFKNMASLNDVAESFQLLSSLACSQTVVRRS